MLHFDAVTQMFRFLAAQIRGHSIVTECGACGGRRDNGADFCVYLSFPSYSAFRQQSIITYHRLMMHVITLSSKYVITFSFYSRGPKIFLDTGLAIE
jgi:hypothetical protein